jgi:hypothetical protein
MPMRRPAATVRGTACPDRAAARRGRAAAACPRARCLRARRIRRRLLQPPLPAVARKSSTTSVSMAARLVARSPWLRVIDFGGDGLAIGFVALQSGRIVRQSDYSNDLTQMTMRGKPHAMCRLLPTANSISVSATSLDVRCASRCRRFAQERDRAARHRDRPFSNVFPAGSVAGSWANWACWG